MKYCPTCQTRYDEEILRFCTKDGAPLIDEGLPNFTATAPREADDFGEDTVVNYKPKNVVVPPIDEPIPSEAPRIVIATDERPREQQVRPRTVPPYQPPPTQSNTLKVVLLTVLGTLAVLGFGVALFVFLRDDPADPAANMNVNTNPPNVNLNTNLNFGAINYNAPVNTNFNVSTNFNTNFNANFNANVRTPTPTPKPSPNANVGLNTNSVQPNTNLSSTPRPSPSPSPTLKVVTPSPSPRVSPSAPLPGGRPVNSDN